MKINYHILKQDWFIKHQRSLLWLLNHFLIGRLLRWYLGIKEKFPMLKIIPEGIHYLKAQHPLSLPLRLRSACSSSDVSVGAPSEAEVPESEKFNYEIQAVIYAGTAISALLIKKFFLFFYLMHLADLFLDKFCPKYSFGFDQLVQNGLDGIFEKGCSYNRGFSWFRTDDNVGDSGVTYQKDTTSVLDMYLTAGDVQDFYRYLSRIFIAFDLRSISASSYCNSANVSMYCSDKFSDLGEMSAYICYWAYGHGTSWDIDSDDYLYNWQHLSIYDQITCDNMVENSYNVFSVNNGDVEDQFGDFFGVAFLLDNDWANSPYTEIDWVALGKSGYTFSTSVYPPKITVNYTVPSLKLVMCGL